MKNNHSLKTVIVFHYIVITYFVMNVTKYRYALQTCSVKGYGALAND